MNEIRHRTRTFVSSAVAIGFMGLTMAACSATTEHMESSQEAVTADNTDSASDSGAGSSGDLIYGYAPPPDPTQEFYLRDSIASGVHSQYSVGTACRSVGADGSIIDGADRDELPVGGGGVLRCTRPDIPVDNVQSFTTANADADENWCLRFTYDSESYQTSHDPNHSGATALNIRATGPTELTATHDGDSIMIKTILGHEAEKTWPLWVDAAYKIKDVKKAPSVDQCNAALGII